MSYPINVGYYCVYMNKEVLKKKELYVNSNHIYLYSYCGNNLNLYKFT